MTLAKTCESISEMKQCREPAEWSLLAVQNTRTGKSHYLVICRCPDKFKLGKWIQFFLFFLRTINLVARALLIDSIVRRSLPEGPMSHDQPSYANLPGIRVFGMKCVAPSSASSSLPQRKKPTVQQHRLPPKPNQSSYQYLHRPDSIVHASELPQHIQHHGGQATMGALTNGYGRSSNKAAGIKAEDEADEQEDATETTEEGDEAAMETTTEPMSGDDGQEEEEEKEVADHQKTAATAGRQMRGMQWEKRNRADHNEYSSRAASSSAASAGSDNYVEPEFPWHKVMELQEALHWNTDDATAADN